MKENGNGGIFALVTDVRTTVGALCAGVTLHLGKEPKYTFSRKVFGTQSWYWMLWTKEESLSLAENCSTVLWLSDGLLIIILKITFLKVIVGKKRKR
jgi:hypothetical protein